MKDAPAIPGPGKARVMKSNRLPDLLHYVIAICDPSDLGATKLNKICWYSDLEAFRLYGRTISGADRYRRLQHGPALAGVHFVLRNLQRQGMIAISEQNYYGRPKTMFMSQQRPNLSAFSAEEIAIIDQITNVICSKHTAVSISSISHDALWEEIELGGDIPVAAASVIPGEITAEDLDWAAKAVDELDAGRPTA
jgi:hypothetical protein